MKIRKEFDINWESLNFLEERICEPIWDILYQCEPSIPKKCKVKLTIEFIE